MRPYAFGFVAAVSLLLSVATVVLWVRSYLNFSDCASYHAFSTSEEIERSVHAFSRPGHFQFWYETDSHPGNSLRIGWQWHLGRRTIPSGLPDVFAGEPHPIFATFSYHHHHTRSLHEWSVDLPHWVALLIFGILPLLWLRRHINHLRQHRFDLCSICGYSLTGNTSGTCPECGSPIPKAPEPKSPRPV